MTKKQRRAKQYKANSRMFHSVVNHGISALLEQGDRVAKVIDTTVTSEAWTEGTEKVIGFCHVEFGPKADGSLSFFRYGKLEVILNEEGIPRNRFSFVVTLPKNVDLENATETSLCK